MLCRRVMLGFVVAACILPGASSLAQKQDIKKIQGEIQATYSKMPEAYRNRGLKAYATLLTPDVKLIGPDGKVGNFKSELAFAKEDMEVTENIRIAKLLFHKSTMHGGEVVSDATVFWDSDLIDTKGEYGPKDKVYPIIWKQRGIMTHVKKGHDWLLKRVQWKQKPNITSNGKPLVPLAKKK